MKTENEYREKILKEFMKLPSVGKAVAMDLWNMGFRKTDELKNQNPYALYRKLNAITGETHDICMLYTFRCIVYYVSEKEHDIEKLKWWNWKNNFYNEEQ